MDDDEYKARFPRELRPYLINYEDLEVGKNLGSGSFGNVCVGKYNGKEVAIKTMKEKTLSKRIYRMFISEITALYECQNPFVIKLIGFTNKYPYTIVTELASNGDLYEFLTNKKYAKFRTPTQLTKIAIGIVYGMSDVHKMGMIHRDLKPFNILMTHKFSPRICDFGLVREEDKPNYPTLGIGTYNYMAPEIIGTTGEYNEKVDVFSFAMILYQMLTGNIPYSHLRSQKIIEAIKDGIRPDTHKIKDEQMQNLLSECWNDIPSKRPSFSKIYERFKNGLMFKGADRKAIDDFINLIEQQKPQNIPHLKLYEKGKPGFDASIPFQTALPTKVPTKKISSRDPTKEKEKDKNNKHKSKNRYRDQRRLDSKKYQPTLNISSDSSDTNINKNIFDSMSESDSSQKNKKFRFKPRFGDKTWAKSAPRKETQYGLQTKALRPSLFDSESDSFERPYEERERLAPKHLKESRAKAPTLEIKSTVRQKKAAPTLLTPTIKIESSSEDDNIMKQEASFANMNSPYFSSKTAPNTSILRDPRHPLFSDELHKVNSKSPAPIIKTFMKIALDHIKQNSPAEVLKEVFEVMSNVLENETARLEFDRLGFKQLLPYDEESLFDSIFKILEILFDLRPSLFEHNFKKTLLRVMMVDQWKALKLVATFAKHFLEIEYPWEILDVSIKNSKSFFNTRSAPMYLSMLYNLLNLYDNFYESRISVCRPVFCSFLKCSDFDTKKEAYKAIIYLYDNEFVLPFETIFGDLDEGDSDVSDLALTLLLIVKKLPTSEDFVFAVVKLCKHSKKANLLLLKLLQHSAAASILAETTNWLLYDLPTFEGTLSIFISLLVFKSSKDMINEAKELPEFLIRFVEEHTQAVFDCFPVVFAKISFSDSLQKKLKNESFFHKLLLCLNEAKRSTTLANLLEGVSYVIESCYDKCFNKLIEPVSQYIEEKEQVSRASLKVLVALASHEEFKEKLRSLKLEKKLSKKFGKIPKDMKLVEEYYEFLDS